MSSAQSDEKPELATNLQRAAAAIRQAKGLLVAAGAGMGVDSGLPDFRGNEGFWNAYPPFRRLGLSFVELANPRWFRQDPQLAWGFYGHRWELYTRTSPHAGYGMLRQLAKRMPREAFVFTSNVDGHFQAAGFLEEQVVECHGSLRHLQCLGRCEQIWEAGDLKLRIDPETLRATGPLPRCPACGSLARPNILMFGDWDWREQRTAAQEAAYRRWLTGMSCEDLVVIECGAGTAVPTVRYEAERVRGTLIRINPRDYQVPAGQISLPLPALAGLERLLALLE